MIDIHTFTQPFRLRGVFINVQVKAIICTGIASKLGIEGTSDQFIATVGENKITRLVTVEMIFPLVQKAVMVSA